MATKILATFAAIGLALSPIAAGAVTLGTDRFEFVDTDRSGDVSFVEFQSAFEGDNDDISQADFDRFDMDSSGGLDIAEYEVAVTSIGTGNDFLGISSSDGDDS